MVFELTKKNIFFETAIFADIKEGKTEVFRNFECGSTKNRYKVVECKVYIDTLILYPR